MSTQPIEKGSSADEADDPERDDQPVAGAEGRLRAGLRASPPRTAEMP